METMEERRTRGLLHFLVEVIRYLVPRGATVKVSVTHPDFSFSREEENSAHNGSLYVERAATAVEEQLEKRYDHQYP